MNSQVFLTVECRRKDIPYPAETHKHSQNYGFKSLKGKPEKAEKIQEAIGFPGIIHALKAINASDSPFFSIGCEKYIGPHEFGGYYARGYIEFSFNYSRMVSFPQAADLFRTFSGYCDERGLPDGVTYNFDLQPAHFVRAKIDGYSCCVWIMTSGHASYEEAVSAFNHASQFFGEFIAAFGPPEDEPERLY